MIVELILSALFGLGIHQTKRISERMPDGWRELTNYAIGVVGTSALLPLWWHRLGDVSTRPEKRGFLAYSLAFLGVGSGVALGWLIDALWGEG